MKFKCCLVRCLGWNLEPTEITGILFLTSVALVYMCLCVRAVIGSIKSQSHLGAISDVQT